MAETYVKDDYLNATKYAKQVDEKVATVKKNLHFRPEPEAHEILNKYIEEIKAKGESK